MRRALPLLLSLLAIVVPTTVAAATTGHLSGVVRDHDGRAQADAEVVLFDPSGRRAGTETTGSGGGYSFDVSMGVYDLALVTREPVARVARIAGVDVGADTDLDIVVLPPYVTLSGTVRDAAGVPLGRNVKVQFGWSWVDTDDHGRFSLTAPAGTAPLSVSMRGEGAVSDHFTAAVEEVDLTSDRTLDLTLAFSPLTVRLVDERDTPLANGWIWTESPRDCPGGCPAGFELFPGSGLTTATSSAGGWTNEQGTASITTLAVDQLVRAQAAPPGLLPADPKRVSHPWSAPVEMVQRDAPPPPTAEDPPILVTWTGVLRHNGAPVEGSVGGYETDDGQFELRLPAGHHSLDVSADIGRSVGCDSGGCSDATHITISDVELTADRTMDINIPATGLPVHVVDQDGHPVRAGVSGRSGGDAGAPVEFFPGGSGRGWIADHSATDAAGNATLLMFPGSPPPIVSASQNGSPRGSASVAPSATSVTVQFSAVVVSGTVRDARGPLPMVNGPWVSFTGQYGRYGDFDGDDLNSDGSYALQVMPGRHTLVITDKPQFDEDDTDDYAATATLPKVWTIRTDLDLNESTTLDLTIPDAAPAHFRAVRPDGLPLPSHFGATSSHTVELGGGLDGDAYAESGDFSDQGRFEHMLFERADTTGGIRLPGGDWNTPFWGFTVPHLEPGDHIVLALSSPYSGGDLVPTPTTTTTIPTDTTTTRPSHPGGPDPGSTTAETPDNTESGYWALSSDGQIYNFGAAALGHTTPGAVDLEPTLTGKGYWTLNRNGTVDAFGDATRIGDVKLGQLAHGEEPASLSTTPSGSGYWVFTNRGRVLPFGDAPFLGDLSAVTLNGPVLDSVATPTGAGYWMVASDGGIFSFGDAEFHGSMGGHRLNQPVMSMAADPDGSGYWLVASDGGIFSFDAAFYGSMGGTPLNQPVSGMVPGGHGYLMVAEDGGIFTFGDVAFHGSLGADPPDAPVVAVALMTG